MTALYPQAELIDCYNRLTDSLGALATAIRGSKLPLWVPLTEAEKGTGLTAREKTIQLYCDIWYQDGQDGRLTRSCHGLVAADEEIMALADRVNRHKQAFRQAVATIRKLPDGTDHLAELNQRNQHLREDLNNKGLGRLHLKQCYRLIPCITQHPSRVGFNWYSSGRSIQKITMQAAERQLIKMGLDKPHLRVQYDRLRQLPPGTPLARVQQQAPLMRGNLRIDHQQGDSERNAMNLSLPLLFLQQPSKPFPEYNQPPLQPPRERQRQTRSDRRIEDSPFLPALRIHRYRQSG